MTVFNKKFLRTYLYPHVFVAGTFDWLHAGNRRLLVEAFAHGRRITIGLTSDQFVRQFKISNFKFKIRKYEERKKALEKWLNRQKKQANIIPISDPHEPAASMKDLSALIVTKENRVTGERINALRQAKGLSPLALIEVPIVPAEDGKPISSTRLRNGEIDRDGRLIMPESMRKILGKPMGNILRGKDIAAAIQLHTRDTVITVGDLSTKTVLDAGVMPSLAIIDGQVGRKPFPETLTQLRKTLSCEAARECLWKIKSGPGFISREAVNAIQDCLLCHVSRVTCHVLVIDGEEDLLVLPAIEYAPLGSLLYYGQPARNASQSVAGGPGEGLVEVIVTDVVKKDAQHLLPEF